MVDSPARPNPLRVRFGEFELDEANALLIHSGSGVALSPTPFKLLCTLVRHAGSLLTKHALLDEVWGHRFVSDSVLKGTISDIRTTLGDDSRNPSFIETVARRGYRFIAVPISVHAPKPSGLLELHKARICPSTRNNDLPYRPDRRARRPSSGAAPRLSASTVLGNARQPGPVRSFGSLASPGSARAPRRALRIEPRGRRVRPRPMRAAIWFGRAIPRRARSRCGALSKGRRRGCSATGGRADLVAATALG